MTYSQGLRFQAKVQDRIRQQGEVSHIIGCEHQAVLTKGRSLHGREFRLSALFKDFEIIEADRGGELALHSPGQLIIYPIINLKFMKWSVRDYICVLHKVTKKWLKQEGVMADVGPQPGLWTQKGKIAFLGIRIQNGISTHGIAINIHNDLKYYESFVACGVKNAPVDRLVTDQSLEILFQKWLQTFLDSHANILCSTEEITPSVIR